MDISSSSPPPSPSPVPSPLPTSTTDLDDPLKDESMAVDLTDNTETAISVTDRTDVSTENTTKVTEEIKPVPIEAPPSPSCSLLCTETSEIDCIPVFPELASSSASLVRGFYLFPAASDLETCFIVLIQDECVSVWWRESDEETLSEWSNVNHILDEEPTNFECSTSETSQCIWIGLVYDGTKDLTLTHLRFNKLEKSVKIYLRELFSSLTVSAEMINKCQLRRSIIRITSLPHEKSALSIPGPSNTIQLFLYDLPTSQKTLLTSIRAKSIPYTYLLPVDDWDNLLIALFDNRIQLWNIDECSLVNSFLLERSYYENKICFNVLHDKGLVYMFNGDSRSSEIEVIALNPKTGKYATLMNWHVFGDNLLHHPPVNRIKRFKRIGNQLVLIKSDAVILYDLANNKTVLNCGQASIADTSIGVVRDKTVIFAATLYGKIINLLNS